VRQGDYACRCIVVRDAGVAQEHGFKLIGHVANVEGEGQPLIKTSDRAFLLLEDAYDFLCGLHHEPCVYQARGEKRFVYLAQGKTTGMIESWRIGTLSYRKIWRGRDSLFLINPDAF
jgi:hypothetical protein